MTEQVGKQEIYGKRTLKKSFERYFQCQRGYLKVKNREQREIVSDMSDPIDRQDT